jgi:hypothetical protein
MVSTGLEKCNRDQLYANSSTKSESFIVQPPPIQKEGKTKLRKIIISLVVQHILLFTFLKISNFKDFIIHVML